MLNLIKKSFSLFFFNIICIWLPATTNPTPTLSSSTNSKDLMINIDIITTTPYSITTTSTMTITTTTKNSATITTSIRTTTKRSYLTDNCNLENSTSKANKCVSEFEQFFNSTPNYNQFQKLQRSLCLPDFSFEFCSISPFSTGGNCSLIQQILLQNTSSFAFSVFCSSQGLQVFPFNLSNPLCLGELSKTLTSSDFQIFEFFCSFESNLNCTSFDDLPFRGVDNNILKIFYQECLRKNIPTTSKSFPLLKNPVGPDAITAIVVIICLTIVMILSGFFFWPKCHQKKNFLENEKSIKITKINYGSRSEPSPSSSPYIVEESKA